MVEEKFEKAVNDAKEYADLEIKNLKLQLAGGLSVALANALTTVLIIALVITIAIILGSALIGWLNALLGGTWGAVIVAGVFILMLVYVISARKRLFRDMFVKQFIEAFFIDED